MTATSRAAIVAVVIIVLLLLGYLVWKERSVSQNGGSLSLASSTIATSSSASTTTSSPSGGTVTVTPIYMSTKTPAPNYALPLVFSATDLSAADKASMQSSFAQVQATLKQDPTDFNSWIQLGDLRKEAGDYQGAAADWQYTSVLYPTNVVSFANLADLYTNFSPDYPKAVVDYKQAIENDPTQVYLYIDLYQLYTNQYPQSSATIETLLREGIAANPNATELQTTLSQYQSAHP